MNFKQNQAVETAVAGHNLLILGSAGTGKTNVVTEIYRTLCKNGKGVKVTCTTGIACSQYDRDMNVSTIHSYLGLSDGRYSPNEIIKIHHNVPVFSYVERNLMSLDTLIIDECSMLSKRTFDTILTICGHAKRNIQLILVGDFFQLPPVANTLYQDNGDFCFESECFDYVFKHRVILRENYRTNDEHLQKLAGEVFQGQLSVESMTFLYQLKRPLDTQDSVKLFSKNDLVDDFNRKMLLKQSGPLYEFVSNDSGDPKALDKITAPRSLWVKIGAPVILLQNLSDTLVNGLVGQVQAVDNGLIVTFAGLNKTITIRKVKFTIFDPALKRNIAEREQYPLKPAYGLTIHKAQGMSLERVVIDCRDIFRPGQLGVALSRATASEGVRVLNFHRRYVMKPPPVISDFMKKNSADILPDLSCCPSTLCTDALRAVPVEVVDRGTHGEELPLEVQQPEDRIVSSVTSQPSDAEILFEEEDLDDEFNEIISSVVSEEAEAISFDFPEGFEFTKLRDALTIDKEVTDSHKRINEIVSHLNEDKLKIFSKKILLKLGTFVKNQIDDGDSKCHSQCIPEKKIVAFYTDVHQYNTSTEYRMHCIELFEGEKEFADEHMIVAYKIVEFIRIFYIQQKVELLKLGSVPIYRRYVTNASHARIRYVAGYCVSNLRGKYEKEKKSKMFSRDEEAYNEAKCRADIINTLKEDEHYLSENSSYQDSLLEIERRQYAGKKLTNVNDSLYEFFLTITNQVIELLIYENLVKYGKDMYQEAYEKIYENTKLYEQFLYCVSQSLSVIECNEEESIKMVLDGLVLQSSQCLVVYVDVINKLLRIFIAQFRRDVKNMCKVEKKMAHRKQIRVSSKKGKNKKAKQSTGEIVTSERKGTRPRESAPGANLSISEEHTEVSSESDDAETIVESIEPAGKSTGRPRKGEGKAEKGKGRPKRTTKPTSELPDTEQRPSTSHVFDQYAMQWSSDSDDAEATKDPIEPTGKSTGRTRKVERKAKKGRGRPKTTPKPEILDTEPRHSTSQDTEESDNVVCVKCLTVDKEDIWILCDSCDGWYHRSCAGLKSKNKWMKYQKKGAKFFCKECA